MNKKGALELSMNTIIIIVIGVVLLSLGLMFVRGIFGKVQTLSEGAFEEAENVLNQIATHDQELTVPSRIDIKHGEQKTFRIWVVNLEGPAGQYTLGIDAYSDNLQNEIRIQIPSRQVTLDTGEEVGYVVGVTVPKNTSPGLYGYTATAGGSEGDFYIKVE